MNFHSGQLGDKLAAVITVFKIAKAAIKHLKIENLKNRKRLI